MQEAFSPADLVRPQDTDSYYLKALAKKFRAQLIEGVQETPPSIEQVMTGNPKALRATP